MNMAAQLQKLPLGIQDFEKLRTENALYVDKTRLVYDMVQQGGCYFLSRPRRFGKSLLMSTIQAYYEGKKELFDGTIGQRLAIADKEDVTWEAHPVLHLDLNTQKYDSPEKLDDVLNAFLNNAEEIYGRKEWEVGFGLRFEGIIERAYQKWNHRVVILIDEYDKPLLESILNPELQAQYRATLKGFYGALKSKDGCIKFALLTGVTRFSKVSIFSGLNNLNDISMVRQYSDICGITEQELRDNFGPCVERLAQANGLTCDECLDKLRTRYDGYHFHQNASGIYNPFSLLKTFITQDFGSYWFETGTPSYLVQLLQQHDYNLEEMSHAVASSDVLGSIDATAQDPIPVLYQSGYLTIKGYDREFGLYELGFPNEEVEEGFVKYLEPFYTSRNPVKSSFDLRNFVLDVRAGRTEQFVKRLRSLFADTPYELVRKLENHYQNVLWLLFKLMGFYVQAEYHTSEGRIDLVLQTPGYCYVLEFKLDGTAEEALAQISDRSYTLPFELSGQKIIRIGMNFSSTTRNIERYVIA